MINTTIIIMKMSH